MTEMSGVLSTLKEINHEKGMKNEKRFFDAMNDATAKDMPPWILYARRPTSTQDKDEGIDAIVETSDVGQLFVQIKSSKAYAEKFKKGRHFQKNKSIVVVVIGYDDTPEFIRAKTRKLLAELRQNFHRLQHRICNK